MDNHFHILLEVPPMAESGLSDEELLKRLSAIYGDLRRFTAIYGDLRRGFRGWSGEGIDGC